MKLNVFKPGPEGRRFLVFLVILAALLAYVNWHWQDFSQEAGVSRRQPPPDAALVTAPIPPPSGAQPGDFYVETRLERDRARSEQQDLLRSILEDQETTAEARAEAQLRLVELTRRAAMEAEAESLIRAKGFADAIVFLNDQGAVVVMKASDLKPADAAKIADATASATGVSFEQVKIIPYVR